MPVWNSAETLRDSVEAIQAQIFQDWDLTICVNASEDNTLNIALDIASSDPRVNVIGHPKNFGALANFDYAREHASGKYFMWAAGDDVRHPNFLKKAVSVLESDQQIVCVFGDFEFIDSRANILEWAADFEEGQFQIIVPEVLLKFPGTTSSFYGLFRFSAISQAQLNYRGEVKYNEGHELPFIAQVAVKGSFAKLKSTMLKYDMSSSWNTERPSRWELVSNLTLIVARILMEADLDSRRRISILWAVFQWNFGGFWLKRFLRRGDRVARRLINATGIFFGRGSGS
jgi:glycosyltransferase involved in cell wall biosynthesis